MAGNFSLKKFSDIDLNDPFFDSLKADYPVGGKVKPFEVWFPEKAQDGRTALVFDDENGLGACPLPAKIDRKKVKKTE